MNIKYEELTKKSIEKGTIDAEDIKWIMNSSEVELLPLLYSAYKIRYKYCGKKVKIQVINNVQSGNCSEDCNYCAQSKNAKEELNIYPMKNEKEILEEAKNAYKIGAFRYCMVFSGRDLGGNRIKRICDVVKKIKQLYNIEVCVSAGFLTEKNARDLKNAGVNRYNHNLNTSREYYGNICSTHDFSKRIPQPDWWLEKKKASNQLDH